TRDLRIKSPQLYQLSYQPKRRGFTSRYCRRGNPPSGTPFLAMVAAGSAHAAQVDAVPLATPRNERGDLDSDRSPVDVAPQLRPEDAVVADAVVLLAGIDPARTRHGDVGAHQLGARDARPELQVKVVDVALVRRDEAQLPVARRVRDRL